MRFHRFLVVAASALVFACSGAPTGESEVEEGALQNGTATPKVPNDAGNDADADGGANDNKVDAEVDADVDADVDAGRIAPGEYYGDNPAFQVSVGNDGTVLLTSMPSPGVVITVAQGGVSGPLLGEQGDTCPGYDIAAIDATTIEISLLDGSARASCMAGALGRYRSY